MPPITCALSCKWPCYHWRPVRKSGNRIRYLFRPRISAHSQLSIQPLLAVHLSNARLFPSDRCRCRAHDLGWAATNVESVGGSATSKNPAAASAFHSTGPASTTSASSGKTAAGNHPFQVWRLFFQPNSGSGECPLTHPSLPRDGKQRTAPDPQGKRAPKIPSQRHTALTKIPTIAGPLYPRHPCISVMPPIHPP